MKPIKIFAHFSLAAFVTKIHLEKAISGGITYRNDGNTCQSDEYKPEIHAETLHTRKEKTVVVLSVDENNTYSPMQTLAINARIGCIPLYHRRRATLANYASYDRGVLRLIAFCIETFVRTPFFPRVNLHEIQCRISRKDKGACA